MPPDSTSITPCGNQHASAEAYLPRTLDDQKEIVLNGEGHLRAATAPSNFTESEKLELSKYTLSKRPWRLYVTPFADIVQNECSGNGTLEDPFIVQWLKTDQENPKNYGARYKWIITMLVAFMSLCPPLASSAYSGAEESIVNDFQCSPEVFLLGLSLMGLGFALGPVVWAPLSEVTGRRNVFLGPLSVYILWTAVSCAAQNIQTLIVFRFFSGTFGASALVIPSGTLADMFDVEQRGLAMAFFAAAPFLGPTLGPMIGGFLSAAAGWRWVMGFLALFAVLLTFLGVLFYPETYPPVLLRRRASLLTKVTGKVYMTKMDLGQPLVPREMIRKSLVLPWALLFKEPIVLILSVYMAVVYGTLYLCFAAFPIVFQKGHGWNAGQGGLAFIGILVGIFFGVGAMFVDNKRYTRISRETGGFPPPKERLPAVIIGGGFTIVGLAWFAATDSPNIHWIVPILASIPFGLGIMLIFMPCINYLIDSYVIFAASVMAANSILRSAFGAIFPLFTIYMYDNLGVHWASAVPGFIALACFPFPILFYKYGAAIRRKCKYSAQAAKYQDSLQNNVQS